MRDGFHLDISSLTDVRQTLREIARVSETKCSEVLNATMLSIAERAAHDTPRADRGKIEHELGASSTVRVSKKTGKNRRKNTFTPTPLVYEIVNWRRKMQGRAPVPRSDMEKAARKEIAGRLRAVGSLAGGWSKIIRTLGRITGAGVSVGELGRVKHESGRATAAKPGGGGHMASEIEYNLATGSGRQADGAHSVSIDPRTEKALDTAYQAQIRGLEEALSKGLFDAGKQTGV